MTPINISGLLLLVLLTIILFFFQKETLKSNKQLTLIHQILISGLVIFVAELVFQTIRLSTAVTDTITEKLYAGLRGIIGITLIGVFISLVIGVIIRRKSKPAH